MLNPDDTVIRTKTELFDYIGEFIEVAINMILFTREVYPESIFTRVNRFNVPVPMNNFAQLQSYINTIVETLKPLFFQSILQRISVVVCTKERLALECFCFQFSELLGNIDEKFNSKQEAIDPIDKASLEPLLRSFLLKLSVADCFFKPLPESLTFYVTANTADDLSGLAQAKLQQNQKFSWVLVNTDQATAFNDSDMIPLKSLQSDVIKLSLFAQEINK